LDLLNTKWRTRVGSWTSASCSLGHGSAGSGVGPQDGRDLTLVDDVRAVDVERLEREQLAVRRLGEQVHQHPPLAGIALEVDHELHALRGRDVDRVQELGGVRLPSVVLPGSGARASRRVRATASATARAHRGQGGSGIAEHVDGQRRLAALVGARGVVEQHHPRGATGTEQRAEADEPERRAPSRPAVGARDSDAVHRRLNSVDPGVPPPRSVHAAK